MSMSAVSFCSGGFTAAAAFSFVLAFFLVSAGIVLFSLAGNVYQPVVQDQDSPPPSSDTKSEMRANEFPQEPQEQDLEAQRLLSSVLVTRGRNPVGLGLGGVEPSLQEKSDRKSRPADVELECRDT
jgi:hypothetical protein